LCPCHLPFPHLVTLPAPSHRPLPPCPGPPASRHLHVACPLGVTRHSYSQHPFHPCWCYCSQQVTQIRGQSSKDSFWTVRSSLWDWTWCFPIFLALDSASWLLLCMCLCAMARLPPPLVWSPLCFPQCSGPTLKLPHHCRS
jgi:hypothetical protein